MGGRWVGTGGAVSPYPCPALGPLSASGRGLPHLPILKASPPSQALVVLLAAPAPRSSGARWLLLSHPGSGAGASLPHSQGLQRGSCSPKEGGGPVSTASQSLIFSQNCIGVSVCLGGFEQSGKAHAIMRNVTVDDSGHSILFAVSCSFLMEGTDPQLGGVLLWPDSASLCGPTRPEQRGSPAFPDGCPLHPRGRLATQAPAESPSRTLGWPDAPRKLRPGPGHAPATRRTRQ